MGKEIITFTVIDIEKHKFHLHKTPISTGDKTINKILASSKVAFCKKSFNCFIGCKDGEVNVLFLMLLKIIACKDRCVF